MLLFFITDFEYIPPVANANVKLTVFAVRFWVFEK